MSKELTLIKQWLVSFFDEHDVEYVKGIGCSYEVNDSNKVIKFTAHNGQQYQFADRSKSYGLYILTENADQESMIMLKFSEDIKLMHMWWANEWTRYELQPNI